MALADCTLREFLAELGARQPVPGGGAAVGVAGALAAALARMVRNYSAEPAADGAHAEGGAHAAAGAAEGGADAEGELVDRFLSHAEADARAFERVARAWQLPRKTAEERARRAEALQAGLREAIEVPLALAETCVELARRLAPLALHGNRHVVADAEVAAHLAWAALAGAEANVAVNAAMLEDERLRAAALGRLAAARQAAAAALAEVVQAARRRAAGQEVAAGGGGEIVHDADSSGHRPG
ncbi:MAG: cyclodeaminase/cyclohydrolase family protein [Firmicutes bacterium]|nr:cyclodeaminase/cyclohydrolase family protein [Bacillota bacterium]